MKDLDIIVFSHLRWEFVTQRPQHIISRLAQENRILFIEEFIEHPGIDDSNAISFQPIPSLTVVQPYKHGLDKGITLADIVQEFISEKDFHQPVLWFYSAAFVTVADYIDHSIIVYDCMDELTAFNGADKNLIAQEKRLFEIADVVFTGGKSLFEAKKDLHEHVYCFPSSVDESHFAKALDPDTVIPDNIRNIKPPVILYYGVIDERIDLQLLNSISEELPHLSFVMVGPVVKIDIATLPQKANIHYLGNQPYDQLPGYLKATTIAIMPFAINKSTQYISPTKTLEYFAARKPVISTPIKDVISAYQYIVKIIYNTADFEAAIEYFLKEPSGARKQRETLQESIIKDNSWDETVRKMILIIDQILLKTEKPTSTVGIP